MGVDEGRVATNVGLGSSVSESTWATCRIRQFEWSTLEPAP